jgi:hypothetical protein
MQQSRNKTPSEASTLWSLFKRLLMEMETCISNTFKYEEDNLYQSLSESEVKELYRNLKRKHPQNDELNELWSTGCYFPNFPIVRLIEDIKISSSAASRTVCSKKSFRGEDCAPGTVAFYCVEHQFCIGFVVLDEPESPRTIYEVLMTRFVNLPELVIYDNGCNLSEYILNRLPFFARRMRIMVDNFHYSSHINCSPTFDTHMHPAVSRKLNTALFEQKNSLIARLKMTAPLMLLRTFFSFLRYQVAYQNIKQHRTYVDNAKAREKERKRLQTTYNV